MNNIYLNGVRIAALNEGGGTAYYLTDQVDSVSTVLDDSGKTLSRIQYQPYGEAFVHKGDTDFAPKYNSQELDKETNFYFYNARYYDPAIARFTSADTVIDGQWDTQGWNRYSYVKGNPIRYKDPTGHEGEERIVPIKSSPANDKLLAKEAEIINKNPAVVKAAQNVIRILRDSKEFKGKDTTPAERLQMIWDQIEKQDGLSTEQKLWTGLAVAMARDNSSSEPRQAALSISDKGQDPGLHFFTSSLITFYGGAPATSAFSFLKETADRYTKGPDGAEEDDIMFNLAGRDFARQFLDYPGPLTERWQHERQMGTPRGPAYFLDEGTLSGKLRRLEAKMQRAGAEWTGCRLKLKSISTEATTSADI